MRAWAGARSLTSRLHALRSYITRLLTWKMTEVAAMTLNNGRKLPIFAFGTATANIKGADGEGDCSDNIVRALQAGFRHLDTAPTYGNESAIKKALQKWGGDRIEVTISTKVGFSHDPDHKHDFDALLAGSLKNLGVVAIDLWYTEKYNELTGYPNPMTLGEAWKKMEGYVRDGRVRSIGISNFAAKHIEEIAQTWTIPPVVNEIEYHQYCFSDPQVVETVVTCRKYGIAIGAYTTLVSLGNSRSEFQGGPVDAVVKMIATDHGDDCTPAQVLLAWARQHIDGGPIVTTSTKGTQLIKTLQSVHLNLSDEEMDAIDKAGMSVPIKRRYAKNVWGDGYVGNVSDFVDGGKVQAARI